MFLRVILDFIVLQVIHYSRHCTFKQKAIVAEEAGCKGIIIFDYNQKSEIYIGMVDDDSVKQSNIAAAFLLGQNG